MKKEENSEEIKIAEVKKKTKELAKQRFLKCLPYDIAGIIILVVSNIILQLDTINYLIMIFTCYVYNSIMNMKKEKVLPLNRVVIDFKGKGKSTIKVGNAVNLSNKAKEDAIENFKILQ